MKLPSLLCALGIAAIACAEPSGPAAHTVPRPNFAEANTLILDIPVDYVLNSCTGEAVHVTGDSHFKSHTTLQPDGGLNTEITYTTTHTEAVALVTGTKYAAKDGFVDTQQGIPPGGTATFILNRHLIRQGETTALGGATGDDLFIHSLYHLTVNANGVPTVDHFEFRAECR